MTMVLTLLAAPSPQDPAVAAMVNQLNRGRLVLEWAPFNPNNDHLAPGSDPLLRQTARALSQAEGRFMVYVPAELDPSFPPDTVLSRRRTAVAIQRLIAAGSNPRQLVITALIRAPVATGRARIELVKIE